MSSNTRLDGSGPPDEPFVVSVAPPPVVLELPDDVAAVPELREILDLLETDTQIIARVVDLIARLLASGDVEAATGVPLELWLSQLGHATRADRRMLLRAATTLVDMPATFTAFRSGQITWSQTRAIVDAAARLRQDERAELDAALVDDLATARSVEPDEITWRVVLFAAELEACRVDASEVDPEPAVNRTMMQPRLDGTGGKLWADLDALGFAIADQALATRMRRTEGLEADPANEPDLTARAANRDAISRSRGDALVDIFRESLAGHSGGDAAERELKPAQPLVLATTTLHDLIGLSHGPGQLLTTLTGGRIRITNDALRKLVDEGGAALRLIVTDDTGRAVGVGRKTRIPPSWLREASLALHPECLEPNCRRSARGCDLDHAIPWDPGSEQRPGGTTDLENLGPLCRSGHTRKERRGWKLSPMQPDGNRYWTHDRSGMTIAIPPASRHLNRPNQPPRNQPGSGNDPGV